MLGRVRRRTTLSLLILPIVAAACHRAPTRPTAVSPVRSMSSRSQIEGGEVPGRGASRSTLTLFTESGSTVVDASDSAAVRAILASIAQRAPELTVELDTGERYLRLTPRSQFGDYERLFVVDGVPVANGFRLKIKASSLERVEVIDDSLSKIGYGPRASAGVVLISTTRAR
jgi:hypothetical protein